MSRIQKNDGYLYHIRKQMAKTKSKYYVVWQGHKPGIYDSWEACLQQVKAFPSAKYKSFKTLDEAKLAFDYGPDAELDMSQRTAHLHEAEKPNYNSIAVDAACAGNPGVMEYRGVFTETGTELFRKKFPEGTNNIGEFLAIVHALAWQKQNRLQLPIYSDSQLALGWIRKGVARTKLVPSEKNKELFIVLKRAEKWLASNPIEVPLLKWDTDKWGEIPADFGRK